MAVHERFERLVRVHVPETYRSALEAERVREYVDSGPIIAMANFSFAAIVALLFLNTLNTTATLTWLTITILASFIQFTIWRKERRGTASGHAAAKIRRILCATVILSAFWGVFAGAAAYHGDAYAISALNITVVAIITGRLFMTSLLPLGNVLTYLLIGAPMIISHGIRNLESPIFGILLAIFFAMMVVWVARMQFIRALDSLLKTQKLIELGIRFEHQSEQRGRILADTSHELRTPLNAVIGFSEMMRDGVFGEVQPARYKEYVDHIHGSARHLLSIIDDILDLSKLDAESVDLNIEKDLPLSVLIDEAVTMTRNLARQRDITVTQGSDGTAMFVDVDQRRFRQVLLNLLSNAAKYTPVGGRIDISVETNPKSGLIISITDNGLGMTRREIEAALRPFGRTSSSAETGETGHGLGLPITQELVRLHQGELRIESRKGHGTTMRICLPQGCFRPAPSVSEIKFAAAG